MKKLILIPTFLFSIFALSAQILEPVKWTFQQSGNTLVFRANIDNGWHLYGMNIPEDGPKATNIVFETLENVELSGNISASKKTLEKYDNNFLMTLSYYENSVDFTQKIKLKDKNNYRIAGYVEFMACNDEMCIAPVQLPFEFAQKTAVSENPPYQSVDSHQSSVISRQSSVDSRQSSTDSLLPTDDYRLTITDDYRLTTDDYRLPTDDFWQPVSKDFGNNDSTNASLWWVFAMGLLGGLLALLTPCVWPIIPMTVSFFLKRNDKRGRRDAIYYALSIVIIYVGLGLLITAIFGASALNDLSTNAIFNIFLFLLLVVFAISFFGAFEITLPASWVNRMDKKAEQTAGFVSILFMAFTLALVSFSCTGLIIGFLLVEVGTTGTLLAPAIGMTGFAIALAVPFGFFAFFPALLQSMPRSGGWLNRIKVSLAFLELGFALKFLSTADLTQGWGILPRPLFIGIWIVLALGWALYMFGLIRFPHDSKTETVGWGRRLIAVASIAFAVYLSTGFWGAPLKAVSAFLPPMPTVHFHDYNDGMKEAAVQGKPVFVDFTGYGCVNCRKMEAAVFTNSDVEKLLSQYIVISLYVDDRTKLDSVFITTENGKPLTLKTVGDKWSYLQRHKFGANAQPFYTLLDNNGNLLAAPYSFNENTKEFVEFLKKGIENYKK